MMDQIKIKLPTIEISDEFVSPTEYLRLIVTQQAEHLGLLDGENADAYRKRIECEISIFEQCNASVAAVLHSVAVTVFNNHKICAY